MLGCCFIFFLPIDAVLQGGGGDITELFTSGIGGKKGWFKSGKLPRTPANKLQDLPALCFVIIYLLWISGEDHGIRAHQDVGFVTGGDLAGLSLSVKVNFLRSAPDHQDWDVLRGQQLCADDLDASDVQDTAVSKDVLLFENLLLSGVDVEGGLTEPFL